MNILRISGRTAGPGPRFALSAAAMLALAPALDANCAVVSAFSNSTSITINDASAGVIGKASLYPSVIHVSGIAANTVTRVAVNLNDLSHAFAPDVDILLVETGVRVQLQKSVPRSLFLAREFYRKWGFIDVGIQQFLLGDNIHAGSIMCAPVPSDAQPPI